jgi:hypothetical protein
VGEDNGGFGSIAEETEKTVVQENLPDSSDRAKGLDEVNAIAATTPPAEEPKPQERATPVIPVQADALNAETERSASRSPRAELSYPRQIPSPQPLSPPSQPSPLKGEGGSETLRNLNSLKDAGVEIANGNGVNRMARRVGDYLKGRGLKVVRLTNADHFKYSSTRILYQKGYDREAGHLAGQLGVAREGKEVKKLDRPNIKMKIWISKDLISKNKLFAGTPLPSPEDVKEVHSIRHTAKYRGPG